MKKLMIAAAATAMIGAAQAAYVPVPAPCLQKGGCEPAVFKLTASGKLSMDMGEYKSVQSLKVQKGLLVAKLAAAEDICVPVTKYGYYGTWTATAAADFEYEKIPASATNGLKNVTVFPPTTATFEVTKLAAEMTSLPEIEAAFKGATAEGDALIKTNGIDYATVKVSATCKQYTGGLNGVTYPALTPAQRTATGIPAPFNYAWTVQECTPSDLCGDCYDCVDVYAVVKAGKKTLTLKYQDMELLKWSVFGKNYNKFKAVAGDGQTKYSYSLENEMAFRAEDYAGSEIIDAASLYAVGFGKATLKQYAANSGKGLCTNGVCTPETSADFSLSGWFVGWYDTGFQAEESIYACDTCAGYLYGGTWTAKYDAKLSIEGFDDSDAESYMGKDLDDIIE